MCGGIHYGIKLITGLTQDFAMTDKFKMNSGLGAVGVWVKILLILNFQ